MPDPLLVAHASRDFYRPWWSNEEGGRGARCERMARVAYRLSDRLCSAEKQQIPCIGKNAE